MVIKTTVSAPKMVMDIPGYFPNVIRLRSGKLLVQAMWGNDRRPNREEYEEFYAFNGSTTAQDWVEFNDLRQRTHGDSHCHVLTGHWAVSTDCGKTYKSTGLPPVISYVQKENGDVIALQWYTYRDVQGGVIVRSWCSHDECCTWDAPYDIPVTCPPFTKSGVLVPHRRILHLEGDTYLILVYGTLDGDTHSRSMVFRTVDGFKTMHYYATVAAWEEGMESKSGLTESDMVRTPDGRLLCVMRNESYCPMYQSHSSDNGATWSPMTLFPDCGVDPALCLLDNGVIACSYGRPGVKAAFSETSGKNWQKRLTLLQRVTEINGTDGLPDPITYYFQRSCCYTDVVQTAPNVATVYYSAPKDWSDDPRKNPWNAEHRKEFRIFSVDIAVERE